MDLLLDTQMLVWVGSNSPRLSAHVRTALASADHSLFVSAVTAWEYSDLNQRGRFIVDMPLRDILDRLSAVVLGFPADAWMIAERLPMLHQDPVDRMLIGHAIYSDLTLVTSDRMIQAYPVRFLA